ncbi:malto-oligosyltrehalose trehalohydrolase [Actinokineospora xionganensis]|uniref:Malto-oligosyltrehalose trehalohydrolase n=1 Tax=Actinokineospora xionganensis TaxID=2684470 RepID=A0ABR7KZ75_9PSEU|nr:malto-oligosyltrehalose trehalohydrolase [Actinokineospora xionganensis]MBC6445726.1 malto-oligosyltrehalose trehalohydrolase [Actinokineospora xionganensis]
MTRSDEHFSVWAPHRDQVRLALGPNTHDMARDDRGWWHAEVPGTGDGTDYAFLLDDDDTPLPDPRSLWQPAGVHGPSRRYSHEAFTWTDQRWAGRPLAGGVVYELHIGTFTEQGTFNAALEHLDHLVDLGVDFVEVLPVNAFDGTAGWGYDGVLWGAVHQHYGGPTAFKRFVNACHERGLGVLLDVVYNHLGPSGAYLDRFGPYFAGRTIWGPALNLDGPDSDEVRRYVIDNAVGWLRDFHLDGLRLDAVHALVDKGATHLLEEMAAEVDALAAGLRRPLHLIAESDLNDPKLVTSRDAGGYGLQAQWCDDLHHALHVALTGETDGYYTDFGAPGALATTLRQAFFHAGTWSSFRGRTHGRPVDPRRTSGHRFLCYLQNHDQVGNRAQGDRMTATISHERMLCGAAIVLCSPYTPMIFMGEEWAATSPWQFFASFEDPDLAAAVRDGRRKEFAEHGWGEQEVPDPMDVATVIRSTLPWGELHDPAHKSVYDTYRALIALRRTHPELADPRLDRFRIDTHGDCLVLHRGDRRVVVNLGAREAQIVLDGHPGPVLLSSADIESTGTHLRVPPESFTVV